MEILTIVRNIDTLLTIGSQALAVVSGLADKGKYPALLNVFKQEEHASPYMENMYWKPCL